LRSELPGLDLVLDDPPLPTAELDRLDGVVTGCALAIAQTGTIVLDGGSRCGRRAISLVPDLHICIVEISRILASVPDAIAALASAGLETAPLTFVSGPSATADIEFSRVEGVHGPRRLEVVLVTGPASS
jgi:L-lactate dehydrogenase complex protein LldG